MSELEQVIKNNFQKILKVKGIDYKKFGKIMKWDNAYADLWYFHSYQGNYHLHLNLVLIC